MKSSINYSLVPTYYALCQNEKCTKTDSCLRYLAHQSMPHTVAFYHVVNSKHIQKQHSECSYYRCNTPQQYAKGFIALLNRMPYKEMTLFQEKMMKHFSKTTYYRMRKGEKLISPAEQQYISKLIRNVSKSMDCSFDEYVVNYAW